MTYRPPFLQAVNRTAIRFSITRRMSPKNRLIAAVIIVLAVAVLLVASLYKLTREQRAAGLAVTHALEILEQAALLGADQATVNSEERGFLLDPTAERRVGFDASVMSLRSSLASLKTLTIDDPSEKNAVVELDTILQGRLARARELMQQVQLGGRETVLRWFRDQSPLSVSERADSLLASFKNDERRRLAEGRDLFQAAWLRMFSALVGSGLLIMLSLGGLAAVVINRRRELARSRVERQHLVELKCEQDRFRAAVHAVHGVLWTNDAHGWMCGEQPGWSTLTGQEYNDYQGLGWSKALHPDDVEPTIEAWTAAVSDGRVFVFEHRVRCADGVLRTFAIRAAPVRDTDGEVREWVGIHTDITIQRLSELTNIHLASIVTSAEDAIISVAPRDERIMTWNAAAERLFGYTETEAVGAPVSLLAPADRRSVASGIFRDAASGIPVIAQEAVQVTKWGEVIPVAITATPMLTSDGRLLGMSGMFHDLRPHQKIETALREANAELERKVEERTAELVESEAKLRASEAGFRLLAEHGSDMVGRISADGNWQYVSPASTRILGRAPETMLGHPAIETVHPNDRSAVSAFEDNILSGKIEAVTINVRALHPERGEIWLEIGARALWNSRSGLSEGCVASVRDATERRRLELDRETQAEVAQAANNELERTNRVLDRLARHLARARDQADAANRAKSRFLASMSHELRTPLNGILGYAHLIRVEGNLSPIQASRVEKMYQAGQHLLEMINGVLSLSEVEQGRVELHTAEVDLRGLATTCLDMVRPAATKKGLALTLERAPDAPVTAVLDPIRLRQILLNLLSNAVKFTAEGSVALRLLRVGTDFARIEIVDTGPGIARQKRPLLFRDFERLGADPNEIEGAGLGLALSARLASMMGGRMGYEDNNGSGSVFWLELPLCAPGAQSDAQVAPDRSNGPLRVLIVDDVAMNRDVASAFLKAEPYEVTCLDNGASAVAAVAQEAFDVVLMDVRMPEMDGLDATRRIRALPGSRGTVPIIALTAQAFAEQIAECRLAGMDGHLAKPFSPDGLLTAIAQAVEIGRLRFGENSEAQNQNKSLDLGNRRTILDQATFDRTAVFIAPDTANAYLRTVAERSSETLARLNQVGMRMPEPNSDLEALVHTLAGSAGLFGFERMATTAQQLEFALQVSGPDRHVLVDALKAAIEVSAPTLAKCISETERVAAI